MTNDSNTFSLFLLAASIIVISLLLLGFPSSQDGENTFDPDQPTSSSQFQLQCPVGEFYIEARDSIDVSSPTEGQEKCGDNFSPMITVFVSSQETACFNTFSKNRHFYHNIYQESTGDQCMGSIDTLCCIATTEEISSSSRPAVESCESRYRGCKSSCHAGEVGYLPNFFNPVLQGCLSGCYADYLRCIALEGIELTIERAFNSNHF